MAFVPDYAEWIRARMEYVPPRTASFCGSLAGRRVLDVGCGDMMMALGLLTLDPAHITGLDVHRRPFDVVEHAVREVVRHGHQLPENCTQRLTYVPYGGRRFPFHDHSFDFVFSWGAFEHIADVKLAVSEVARVVKPGGKIFIDVYPWFPSFQGSHLADYIEEPYFQLRRSHKWVLKRLQAYLSAHPEQADMHLGFWRPEGYSFKEFLLEHLYGEYCSLNRCTAREFLGYLARAGLVIEKLESQIDARPAARSAGRVPYVDLVTAGTTVLMRSGKPAC